MTGKEIFNKPPVLTKDEKLGCSLGSKYPYREVQDVINEACLHQRDDTERNMIKQFVEWLHEDIRREIHADGEVVVIRKRAEDWQEFLKLAEQALQKAGEK